MSTLVTARAIVTEAMPKSKGSGCLASGAAQLATGIPKHRMQPGLIGAGALLKRTAGGVGTE